MSFSLRLKIMERYRMWRGAYEGALDIFGILVFENFVFCVEMNLWG